MLFTSTNIVTFSHGTRYAAGVQLRYSFRLYPTPGQQQALARAFGSARVVFNDALYARQQAHAAGLPVAVVHDSGRTQVPAGTPTCAAIGPAPADRVDAVTGALRLL